MPFIIRRVFDHSGNRQTGNHPPAVADPLQIISLMPTSLQRLLFLLESKIAGIAVLLTVDHTLCAALAADLFVIYGRVQRLGLLQALAADRGFKIVARQKAAAALGAFQAVHLAFWFPAPKQSHAPLLTQRNNQCIDDDTLIYLAAQHQCNV
jgi:hypothetical protein